MIRPPSIAAMALLAGCAAAAGDWTRPGADEAAVAREYGDCRTMAASVVRGDAAIDQDILATRGTDWQRAAIGRVEPRNMEEHTRDRAAAIIEGCMRAKGFVKPG
jgi:hypothetical protein